MRYEDEVRVTGLCSEIVCRACVSESLMKMLLEEDMHREGTGVGDG